MQYKIKETGAVFHEHMLKTFFPNTSFSFPVTKDALDMLGLESIPDPVPEPIPEDPVANAKAFMESIVAEVQARLDGHAMEHGYDSILSAVSYQSSFIPRFNTEGNYCLRLRDDTWATLSELSEGVKSGTTKMPTTLDEVLALLPTMDWPT